MFIKWKDEVFDIILLCGDFCGGSKGHKTVAATIRLLREYHPDAIVLSVIGNHDFWYAGKARKLPMGGYSYGNPHPSEFWNNYNKILECFKKHNVHFLDEAGLYIHPDFSDIVLVGHSGWYAHQNPPTNDIGYLPTALEGHTNGFLYKRAMKMLDANLEALDAIYEPDFHTVCFVSHFPVIKAGPDYKGRFEDFSWSESIGDMMQEQYSCKHFFCGHAHQYHNGPLRYESGSDYGNPAYLIVEV